jgi:hypothetical protein
MVGKALPTNIRLGWKGMEEANTLAYYDKTTIIGVNSFIVEAPGCLEAKKRKRCTGYLSF